MRSHLDATGLGARSSSLMLERVACLETLPSPSLLSSIFGQGCSHKVATLWRLRIDLQPCAKRRSGRKQSERTLVDQNSCSRDLLCLEEKKLRRDFYDHDRYEKIEVDAGRLRCVVPGRLLAECTSYGFTTWLQHGHDHRRQQYPTNL